MAQVALVKSYINNLPQFSYFLRQFIKVGNKEEEEEERIGIPSLGKGKKKGAFESDDNEETKES
jgi:hypothetical protein